MRCDCGLRSAVLPEAALQAKSNSCKFAGTGAKAFIARLSVAAAYEPLKQLPPITGLADQPLLPIAEAVKTLPVTQARSYAFVADTSLEWVTAMHGLTRDEMTAVYMYTMQWVGDQGDSLHVALSKVRGQMASCRGRLLSSSLRSLFTLSVHACSILLCCCASQLFGFCVNSF